MANGKTKTADVEAGDKIIKLSDTVKFKAGKAPENVKQYMPVDKVYTLHRLHAERLEKKGLGKIVKEEK